MSLNGLKQRNDVIRVVVLKNWRSLHFGTDRWDAVSDLGVATMALSWGGPDEGVGGGHLQAETRLFDDTLAEFLFLVSF